MPSSSRFGALATSALAFLRRHDWLAFLLQQVLVFILAFVLLQGARLLTGKSIHGGKDMMGPVEFVAMLVLFSAMMGVSVWVYREVAGPKAPALGLVPGVRRLGHYLVGLALGLAVAGWPLFVSLASGEMRVTETLFSRFEATGILGMLALGTVTLTANSIVEEVTSRAVPFQLFRHRALLFRLLVPALLFAALHLADEPFRLGAFYSRTLAGIVFGLAYLLTRDIWLASGLHTGTNQAVLLASGKWHMGALFLASGERFGSAWADSVSWTLLALGLGWMLSRRHGGARAPRAERVAGGVEAAAGV
ncbi:CPBP family glutamic-type intramembrane protease [Archangium gephyra]|uniref:CPBP family glutamic-type intramembrane protease n=1 Tax=Archangium gephyra TaxID=48 RepID=UPI0035D3DC97